MTIISAVRHRLYQDYFMGSRLDVFRALLKRLLALGYRFETISEYLIAAERGERKRQLVCLVRVDVDTDPEGAGAMFAVMQELSIRSTCYFRLSTLRAPLVSRLSESGSEIGYHFEEVATFAKRKGLLSYQQVQSHLEAMRENFRENVEWFAKETGIRPRSAAAHGDFANRRLAISNTALITRRLMQETGIAVHASYALLQDYGVALYSDAPAPAWWQPSDPSLAPAKGPIAIIVHPRQWCCNRAENFRVSVQRSWEEAAWAMRRRMAKTT